VRGLEAMTTDLRERLADMTARRDSWQQQVEAVNRQIADRPSGRLLLSSQRLVQSRHSIPSR